MIDINASVIGSVPLCRSEEVSAKAVEPEPAPPRSVARPRACLEIAQAAPERFVLANRKCAGRSVLAVIERKDAAGKIECKAHTIGRQLAVVTPARPEINYQCILDEDNCTKAHVATSSRNATGRAPAISPGPALDFLEPANSSACVIAHPW